MKKSMFMFIIFFIIFSIDVYAATQGLPWEGPLTKVKDSITGPVAFAISIIAFVAAGAGLVFGGEIQGFMKVAVFIVLAVSFVVAAANILGGLYSTSSSVIQPIQTEKVILYEHIKQ